MTEEDNTRWSAAVEAAMQDEMRSNPFEWIAPRRRQIPPIEYISGIDPYRNEAGAVNPTAFTYRREYPLTSGESIITGAPGELDSPAFETMLQEYIGEPAPGDDSIEEEVKPKARRARKPKEIPLVVHSKNESGTKELRVTTILPFGNRNMPGELTMCPYTKYIPIDYLLGGVMGYINGPIIESQYLLRDLRPEPFMGPGMAKTIASRYILGRRTVQKSQIPMIVQGINLSIRDYLIEDRNSGLGSLYTRYVRNSFEGITQGFRDGALGNFSMRSYRGHIGNLTIYSTSDRLGRKEPEVLLVTLPENYLYHKYNILQNGVIDLDACFLLMNRDLDYTSYPNKNFRTMFNKFLRPIIEEHSVDTYKVPKEFIIENCFTGNFELRSKNIIERKKEIEDLTKIFIARL